MIQFNLLPDVKLEYVKAQRTKQTVFTTALMAAGSAFAVFLLLFITVHVVQNKSIDDLDRDIKKYSNTLKSKPDIEKVLTIQSQLSVLSQLHDGKPATTRTFGFVQQITPIDVTISELVVDYEANTISISGQSKSLDRVNTLVDTLKFTTFDQADQKGDKAFSNVVLTEFTKNTTATTYKVNASFDPLIFDNSVKPKLVVPSRISTRSVVEQPVNLFMQSELRANESSRR